MDTQEPAVEQTLTFTLQPMVGEQPWRGTAPVVAQFLGVMDDGRFRLRGTWPMPQGNGIPTHIALRLAGRLVSTCPCEVKRDLHTKLTYRPFLFVTFDCPVVVG